MTENQLTALQAYIDAKIALAFAYREQGADGYASRPGMEIEAVRLAEEELKKTINKNP